VSMGEGCERSGDRPRSPRVISSVLLAAFRLWRAHLPRLAVMTVLLWSPIEIVAALAPLDRTWLVRGALAGLLEPWWTAGVVILAAAEKRTSLIAILGRARRRYVRLVGVRVVLGARILIGCLCGVVPGVVLATRYALADPMAILSGCGPSDCGTRSYQLLRDRMWSTFVLLSGLAVTGELLEMLREDLVARGRSLLLAVFLGCFFAMVGAFAPLCWLALYRAVRNPHQKGPGEGP